MAQSKTLAAIDRTIHKIEKAICENSAVCKCCEEIKVHLATLKELSSKAIDEYKATASTKRKKAAAA